MEGRPRGDYNFTVFPAGETGIGSRMAGTANEIHQREERRGKSWRDYLPLIVLLGLMLLAATARQLSDGVVQPMSWMHDFMGYFLVVFAMLKLFDPEGFADGFHMYDLLAKRVRPYGYVYPFLELAFGLAYLARWRPDLIYPATVILMLFGAGGVFVALRKGLDLECACMGTILHVPLSTVALVEDLGMAAMAGAMMWMRQAG